VGWLLALGKYDSTLAEQSPLTITAINWLYVYLPLMVALISTITLLFYHLDKEYPGIIEELKKRNTGGEA
jgi:GPH family glycoside/pentoside/hexuronide:cation symporter